MSRTNLLFCAALCFVLVGCESKKGMVEFVDVVHDHRVLTNDTAGALILSIHDELECKRILGTISVGEEEALLDLIERLEYMCRQGDVIEDYVSANYVDDELLARLLRNKWKGK